MLSSLSNYDQSEVAIKEGSLINECPFISQYEQSEVAIKEGSLINECPFI